MHVGLAFDALGDEARASQARGKGHGEAARQGGAYQFLRIAADAVFETGAEGERLVESSPEGHPSGSAFQIPLPGGFRFAYRHVVSPFCLRK